jgi:hypothetical protein
MFLQILSDLRVRWQGQMDGIAETMIEREIIKAGIGTTENVRE